MTMSDPIADMLTRIRNANTAKHDTVDVPASKMKIAIADILLNEGYITKYDIVEDGSFKTIRVTLKYGADKNEKVITGLKRISKPGLRVYASKDELPKVLGGFGCTDTRHREPSSKRIELEALLPGYVSRLSREGMSVRKLFKEYHTEYPDGYQLSSF